MEMHLMNVSFYHTHLSEISLFVFTTVTGIFMGSTASPFSGILSCKYVNYITTSHVDTTIIIH